MKTLLAVFVALLLVLPGRAEQGNAQVITGVCKLGYFKSIPDRYELSFDAGVSSFILSRLLAVQGNAAASKGVVENDWLTCQGVNGGIVSCASYAKPNGVLGKNSLPLKYQYYIESKCELRVKPDGGFSILIKDAVARHIHQHFVGIRDDAPIRLETQRGVHFNYMRWGKNIGVGEARPQNGVGDNVYVANIQFNKNAVPAVFE